MKISPEVSRIITKKTNKTSVLSVLMKSTGELIDTHIVVRRPKDVGRLYNKSHIGRPCGKGHIQLNLLEGVFLLGEQKIKITKGKKTIDFQTLVQLATLNDPDFEINYLVYKDLRNRGLAIQSCAKQTVPTFSIYKEKEQDPQCFICVFSEREDVDISAIQALTQEMNAKHSLLWFAIVDEEGDSTYYQVSIQDMKGQVSEKAYVKGAGVLLANRILLFGEIPAQELFDEEFYGKPFGEGIQLSLVEGLYLVEKNVITLSSKQGKKLSKKQSRQQITAIQPDISIRLPVYTHLKKQGLIVKTGFKFGVHFRAYTQKPHQTHAEYLVHVVEPTFMSTWAEMSRAVRLAHSVNKEIVFALVDEKSIQYIKFGRLRP